MTTRSTSKTAVIIAFPASKRVGKWRRVAENMDGATEKARSAQLKRALDDMEKQMKRASLPSAIIQAEQEAFERAVLAELARRMWQGTSERPGGSAA